MHKHVESVKIVTITSLATWKKTKTKQSFFQYLLTMNEIRQVQLKPETNQRQWSNVMIKIGSTNENKNILHLPFFYWYL